MKDYIWDLLKYSEYIYPGCSHAGTFYDLARLSDPIDLIYSILYLMHLSLRHIGIESMHQQQQIDSIHNKLKHIMPHIYGTIHEPGYKQLHRLYTILSWMYNLPSLDQYHLPPSKNDNHSSNDERVDYIEELRNEINFINQHQNNNLR